MKALTPYLEPMKIPDSEYQITTMRSSGPGGQHANKVETAVQLRFDIRASSLTDEVKDSLLVLNDRRITKDGVIVLKSNRYRSQTKNKAEVVERLHIFISEGTKKPKKRKATKPSKASEKERLEEKSKRSKTKEYRKKVIPPE